MLETKAMKPIKNPDQFSHDDYVNHPAIPGKGKENEAFICLSEAGYELIDMDEDCWQNKGDTLVMAVPQSPFHGPLALMAAIADLRPDEFFVAGHLPGAPPLTDMPEGFYAVIRLWWD